MKRWKAKAPGRPRKVAKPKAAATASPVPITTLEDAVAWSIQQRTRPTPSSPDETLNRWCEYLFSLTPEQMRALTMVQAERFLQAKEIDEGTRAYMAITDSFRAGSTILGKMLEVAAARAKELTPAVATIPDEELLKGLRLVSAQLAEEQPALTTDGTTNHDDLNDEVLPLEGVG